MWHCIRFRFRLSVCAGLALAALPALVACSASVSPEEEAEQRAHRQRVARVLADNTATMAEWRQEWLPRLLAEFDSDEARDWHNARDQLLASDHTPARRVDKNGKIVDTHIRAVLKRPDWSSAENRAHLAREGRIYEQLARFNLGDRNAWRAARRALCEMGPEVAQRAAFELVLRLTWSTENEVGTMAGPPGRGSSSQLEADRAVWAMEELIAIGEEAVPPLIWASTHRLAVEGVEANRFWEHIFYTLGEIGKPAIEPVARDLVNARQASHDDVRFQRVRRLLRTLATIFRNIRSPQHSNFVPDPGDLEAEQRIAVEMIADTLANYRPTNELRLYQVQLYAVQALGQIGSNLACQPLLALWEQVSRKGEEDDEIAQACRDTLMSITGRSIQRLDEWKRYVATLPSASR